jgi:hypothetical protein
MALREKLLNLVDMLVGFFVFAMMTVGIHEYFHANVARMLGGEAEVVFNWLWGYTIVTGNFDLWQIALIALSGGFFTFILYLYFFKWWLEDPSDKYVRVGCFYFVVNQFIYGWLELASFFYPTLLPLTVTSAYSTIVSLGLTLIYFFKWWNEGQ